MPAPGVPVALLATPAANPTGAGKVVASATTNASGAWTLNAPRGPSRKLVLAYGAPPSSATASSISFEETVHPSLTFKVTAPGRARLVFSGRLAITPLGAPRPLVLIEVRAAERLGDGRFSGPRQLRRPLPLRLQELGDHDRAALHLPRHQPRHQRLADRDIGDAKGGRPLKRPAVILATVAAVAVQLAAAAAADGAVPAVTAQAQAANAAFLAYAPPPAGGPGALCLVDTGVSVNPDTQPGLVSATAVDGGSGADVDPDGHGTTMAMIAGAAGNGMIGAWPQIKIVSVRATTAPTPGQEPSFEFDNYTVGMAQCIQQTGHQIHAIDLALSSSIPPTPDQAQGFADKVTQAQGQNIAVIAAAGNVPGPVEEPAAEPGVLAVGAGDPNNGDLLVLGNAGPDVLRARLRPGHGRRLHRPAHVLRQRHLSGLRVRRSRPRRADELRPWPHVHQGRAATREHRNRRAPQRRGRIPSRQPRRDRQRRQREHPQDPVAGVTAVHAAGQTAPRPASRSREARWTNDRLTLIVTGLAKDRLSVELKYAHRTPRRITSHRTRTVIHTGRPSFVVLRVYAGKRLARGPLAVRLT